MENGKQNRGIRLFVPLFFVLMITVNALANILPINGLNTGEVSEAYTNLFTPSAGTFSIWGVIYLLLLLYTLFHVGVIRAKDKHHSLLNQVGFWFILTCLLNSAWIFAWHFKVIWVSLLLMVLLLLCLLKIALVFQGFELTRLEKLVIRLPFSVYFGWISVATIANATVFLISIHWGRFSLSPVVWTVVILVIGAVIGILTTLRFKDYGYLLVFIWAYLGILIRHYSKINGYGGLYPSIMITCGIAIIAFLLTGTISLWVTPKE
jgi:hypothetical protein